MARPNLPQTGEELIAWRASIPVSRARLAAVVGVSERSLYAYEHGERAIPLVLSWALVGCEVDVRRRERRRIRDKARRSEGRRKRRRRIAARRARRRLRQERERAARKAAQVSKREREQRTRSLLGNYRRELAEAYQGSGQPTREQAERLRALQRDLASARRAEEVDHGGQR